MATAGGSDGHGRLVFFEYLLFYIGVSACLLLKIDLVQPEPYMDEIFHIRQSQAYCQGNFSQWDPKITTLPGLYLMTVGLFTPLSWLLGTPIQSLCNVFNLRLVNILFNIGNLYVIWCLVKKLHSDKENYNDSKALVTAFTLSGFPLLFFFNFLYYTDPGSTFCVLLMYLFQLHGNHFVAAILGVISVMFRQTNILWVVFVGGQTVGQCVVEFIQPEKKDIPQETVQNFSFLQVIVLQIFSQMRSSFRGIMNLVWIVVTSVWCYFLVGLGFAYFIIWNNGIVVGDRSAHVACLHFPQLLYFTVFVSVFALPHVLSFSKLMNFSRFLWKRPLLVSLFCGLSFLAVKMFTYQHPYLLADNRHYTFYIWSKIFRRHHLIKFLLIPGYLFTTWSVNSLISTKTVLWKIVFWLVVLLATVPQMLFEFRYFLIPFLIWRINIPLASYRSLTLECILYGLVNIVTLYLFIEKPFKWNHDQSTQRFMW